MATLPQLQLLRRIARNRSSENRGSHAPLTFFLHRFYKHQPDLNVANPSVREEIRRIVGFWLEVGLAGFRVDAVPFLLETDGIGHAMDIAPHGWLRNLRSFVGRRRGDAFLLGEVNLDYEDVRQFFGSDGRDELHMCLNFNLNQALGGSSTSAGAVHSRFDTVAGVHSLMVQPIQPGGR